jgi:serine/threonine protein kinase
MSAGGVQPSNPDPLRETTRYVKVADLSHGSFGFVQLARNTETQELVAIKFIERGDRVNRCVVCSQGRTQCSRTSTSAAAAAARAVPCGFACV